MFVLKYRFLPELCEASSYARLSHSKQLLKYSQNIHPVMLASFLFTYGKGNSFVATVVTPKNLQNDRLYARSSKKIDVATKLLRTQ